MASDSLTPEQELELERLLRLAHLQSIRKQWIEASGTCEKALNFSPQNIKVIELHGDILMECGKLDEALSAYRAAHEMEPDNGAIETKYAKATLSAAEREYAKLPQANLQLQFVHKRNWLVALAASSCFPGFGQLYNHELVKAGILGIPSLISMMLALHSPPFWGVFAVIYIYSMIDAPSSAMKINKLLDHQKSAKMLDIR